MAARTYATDYDAKPTNSIIADMTETKIGPTNGGPFRANDIIRLEFPSQNYVDGSKCMVSFQVKITNQDGSNISHYLSDTSTAPVDNKFARVRNGAHSLFNRIRLLQGSNVIEDIQDYGALSRALTIATASNDWRTTTGTIREGTFDHADYFSQIVPKINGGTGSTAETDNSLTSGHLYALQLNLGLLTRSGKYIPTKYSGQLALELYCEADSECLVTSCTTSAETIQSTEEMPRYPNYSTASSTFLPKTYVINNVYLHCMFVVPIAAYDEAVKDALSKGEPLDIHYDTFVSHTRQVGSGGPQTHTFQERASSLRGGLAVMRNATDINDQASDWRFAANGIKSFQWRLGNQYFPPQAVRMVGGGAEAWSQVQHFTETMGDVTKPGCPMDQRFAPQHRAPLKQTKDYMELRCENRLPDEFIMAVNLKKSKGQISGYNTARDNVDVELNMDLGSTLDFSKVRLMSSHVDGPKDIGSSTPVGFLFPKYTNASAFTFANIASVTEANNPNKYARLNFWANDDMVFRLAGIGTLQIKK